MWVFWLVGYVYGSYMSDETMGKVERSGGWAREMRNSLVWVNMVWYRGDFSSAWGVWWNYQDGWSFVMSYGRLGGATRSKVVGGGDTRKKFRNIFSPPKKPHSASVQKKPLLFSRLLLNLWAAWVGWPYWRKLKIMKKCLPFNIVGMRHAAQGWCVRWVIVQKKFIGPFWTNFGEKDEKMCFFKTLFFLICHTAKVVVINEKRY